MAKILVAGLLNVETTVAVDGFPIAYRPVRYPFHGIHSTVSGVGFNVSKALTTLGNAVDCLALIGDDVAGQAVRNELAALAIDDRQVLSLLQATPQSAVFYDPSGQRMVNTDLKDIQDTAYPFDRLNFEGTDLALLTNINFSRPLLAQAQAANVPIATDVHVIRALDDDYNRDYMAAATVLFMSDEGLPAPPEAWARQLQSRYGTPIIGIGLGSEGALLAVKADNFMERIPARALRPIVNTIGAGDALFAAFVHGYANTGDPYAAMQRAVLFAGYKIGSVGAAEGYLNAVDLERFYQQYHGTERG